MRCQLLALFVPIFLISADSNAGDAPFKPVQEFFAAISARDHNRLNTLVTDNFELLEMGELWDKATLIAALKPSGYTRRNFFSVITTDIQGDMAWVSYWNKAVRSNADQTRERAWLESAVLVRRETGWKIRQLHSTKIDPAQLTEDIVLTEYIE